jgi:hypothetical protein
MKNLSLSLVLALVLAAPLAGNAQSHHPHVVPTNLAGVSAFAAPPEGFDLTTASDEELADWGFPPRPDQTSSPSDYAHWVRVTAALKTRIVPQLEQTTIYHGPIRLAPQAETIDESTLNSYQWSGYATFSGAKSYGSSSFYSVWSDMVVPVAEQAFNACSGQWDYGSSWVGIDGWGSSDVLQGGVEFDAYCSGNVTEPFYSAWYEWYPAAAVRITNFATVPGDDVFVNVWQVNSTTAAAIFINYNTGESVELGILAPAGTKLVGNSAEWVTERPLLSTGLPSLTNYVNEVFWDAEATTKKKAKYYPGSSSAKQINMLDINEQKISVPSHLGESTFLVKDEGSAAKVPE